MSSHLVEREGVLSYIRSLRLNFTTWILRIRPYVSDVKESCRQIQSDFKKICRIYGVWDWIRRHDSFTFDRMCRMRRSHAVTFGRTWKSSVVYTEFETEFDDMNPSCSTVCFGCEGVVSWIQSLRFPGDTLLGKWKGRVSCGGVIYIHIYIYINECIFTHTHTHVNTHTRVYMHIYIEIILCVYEYMYAYTLTRTYIHIHTHAQTHTYMYRK